MIPARVVGFALSALDSIRPRISLRDRLDSSGSAATASSHGWRRDADRAASADGGSASARPRSPAEARAGRVPGRRHCSHPSTSAVVPLRRWSRRRARAHRDPVRSLAVCHPGSGRPRRAGRTSCCERNDSRGGGVGTCRNGGLGAGGAGRRRWPPGVLPAGPPPTMNGLGASRREFRPVRSAAPGPGQLPRAFRLLLVICVGHAVTGVFAATRSSKTGNSHGHRAAEPVRAASRSTSRTRASENAGISPEGRPPAQGMPTSGRRDPRRTPRGSPGDRD